MKNIYSLTVLLMISVTVLSQNDAFQNRLNNLRSQKIAFITQRLNLTTEEAQLFWPVYNELAQKKDKLNKRRKEISFELRNNWNGISEQDKESLSDEFVSLKLKEAKLEVEYHEKFKKVLDVDKVLKLYQSEMAFKNYLINKIKNQNAKRSQRLHNRPE